MRVVLSSKVCMPCRIPLKPSFASTKYLFEQRTRFLPLRHLTYTKHLQQNDSSNQQRAQGEVRLRPEQSESIKPESHLEPNKAKPAEAPKTDALLAEQTISNKEQRRADWNIIKEMAKYIWPKVWLACTSIKRQGFDDIFRMTLEQRLE